MSGASPVIGASAMHRSIEPDGTEVWRVSVHIDGSARPAAEYAARIITESALLVTVMQEAAAGKGVTFEASPTVHVGVGHSPEWRHSLRLTATARRARSQG